MCQSSSAPCSNWWCLLRRRPGPVGSQPHQWALRERWRRDQRRSAERRFLCWRSRTNLPRHPISEPLRPPSVAILHSLSAGPHSSPQQPGLQHGQSGGAGGARRGGTGSEGHGRWPHLRPLYGQQYGISRLPHQPCLMAGWDGPFPVLSLKHGRKIESSKTDSQDFLHFFLSPSKTGMFYDVGWSAEGSEDSQSLSSRNSEATAGSTCNLEKSSEEHLHSTECSV